MKDNSVKKMHWLTLALMSFVPLWGFNNITQGFFLLQWYGGYYPMDCCAGSVFPAVCAYGW